MNGDLDQKECVELAGIFIEMAKKLPERFVSRQQRVLLNAGHTVLGANIYAASKEWYITLARLRTWMDKVGVQPAPYPHKIEEEVVVDE